MYHLSHRKFSQTVDECTPLISGWETSSVTDMRAMFKRAAAFAQPGLMTAG